jgi:thiamine kinase-like enzyme
VKLKTNFQLLSVTCKIIWKRLILQSIKRKKALEQITNVYPRNEEDLVPSHNDLKPENILYDGNKVWLSDWEAAFTNDRYSDLAIIANFVIADEPRLEYAMVHLEQLRQNLRTKRFKDALWIVSNSKMNY